MTLFSVDSITAAYGSGPVVLRDVSLSLDPGEVVGVLGMNGAGKSTLIRVMRGDLIPRSGTMSYDSAPLKPETSAARTRKGIVTLPEGHRVLQPLTVQENLELATLRLGRRAVRRVLDEKLPFVYEMFPILKERRSQMAGLLSGGEQQMLSISRALMANPRALLLDEPSLGLAPAIVARIYDVLPTLAASGIAILIVEQSPIRLRSICSRLIILRDGVATADAPAVKITEDVLREAYFGQS